MRPVPCPLHETFGAPCQKVAVEAELSEKGLQQHPFLIMKIIQLSDSQLTRHCNMLVGRYPARSVNAHGRSLGDTSAEGAADSSMDPSVGIMLSCVGGFETKNAPWCMAEVSQLQTPKR